MLDVKSFCPGSTFESRVLVRRQTFLSWLDVNNIFSGPVFCCTQATTLLGQRFSYVAPGTHVLRPKLTQINKDMMWELAQAKKPEIITLLLGMARYAWAHTCRYARYLSYNGSIRLGLLFSFLFEQIWQDECKPL